MTTTQTSQPTTDTHHVFWFIRLRTIATVAEIASYWGISTRRVKAALANLEARDLAFYAYDVNAWKLTDAR
jgi:predicted ArsR family transcriptional regulator